MINKKFFEDVKELAAEKEIDPQEILDIYETSLKKAFNKTFEAESCEVVINKDKHEILLYKLQVVVDEVKEKKNEDGYLVISLEDARTIKKTAKVGDIIKTQVSIKDDISRVGASTAKNVFNQGLKNIDRKKSFDYFKALEGEMVTATIKEKKDNFLVLSIGRNVTTTLPVKELLPNDYEELHVGDKCRVYIKKVEETTKDPKVYVSRNDKNLIFRLLETYVPEIARGEVEVKGIARDPGDKTKLALYSNDPKIDAVGSVIGEGRSRIEAIKNALNGEKIELYYWSENIEETIAQSLQPARVSKVLNVDPKTKTSTVIVPDEQLSLAIGKNGQNVRLAVQSCGWKIDIKSLSDALNEGLFN